MEKELPKNWVEVELEQLGEDKYYSIGDGDHGQIKPTDYLEKGIPYIRVSDIGWGNFKPEKLVYISDEVHKKNLKSELLPGDILIAKTGATIGKCCIVPEFIPRANTTSSVGKVSINKEITSSKWILYFFLSAEFFKTMWSNSSRTAQPGFNIIHLKKFIIPLPPLTEQNRIVAKLDSLFAQLESIKTSMAKIPVLLKNFRQQVLTQAVTGKLTEEWRKGKNLEEWRKEKLGDICNMKAGKFVSASDINNENVEGYFPCYGGNGLRGFVNSFTHIGKYSLIGRQGALCGNVHLIEGQFHATEHALVVTPISNIDEVWLFHKLTSLELINYSKGVAQPGLSVMNLNPILLDVPPVEEQQQIVSRVESLFTKADAIEEKYKNLKAKIENLPQTILHKAFKGELTEQLESDGDARVLLEEIAALKSVAKRK